MSFNLYFPERVDNCIFMTTKHGGHLGYFEGGYFIPFNVTWLDRVLIEYADAVTSLHRHGNLPGMSATVSEPATTYDTQIECKRDLKET